MAVLQRKHLLRSPRGPAPTAPEPTYLPGTQSLLLNVLSALLFRLPLLSCRQLQEHMEVAWQLLDTDAGLCNVLFSSLLLLLSVSLAAWRSSFLPVGGACALRC